MRLFPMAAAAVMATLLAGCATTGGESLQCSLGRMMGQPCEATAQPSAANDASRWDRVQLAFDEEIEQARAAQQKAVASSASLPPRQRATAGAVNTINVLITDSQTQQQQSIRTLDTVAVHLPLAGKGQPGHQATFNAILDFANLVADNRGSSSVIVYQNPADVSAGRANPAETVLKSLSGKPVYVRKQADSNTPVGMERYVVKAGEIRGQL